METVRKINDELAIAGQVGLDQLAELAEEGYQSIFNLRSPDEAGFLKSEQQKAELLGLYYINIPTRVEAMKPENILAILHYIHDLPKPILLHCDSGIRSAAMAIMYIAMKQGMPLEQAFRQASKLGLLQEWMQEPKEEVCSS